MKLLRAHVKAQALELLRERSALFPTLLLPGMLFVFLGVPNAGDRTTANLILTSYTVFAVLGITFFQFGVGIAHERESSWEVFLRTMPVSSQVRFAARVLLGLVFALAVVAIMVTLALLLTPAGLDLGGWLRWGLALLIGSVPLALLGITLGYWASPRAAAPLANLLYVALAYAGSLWTAPQSLPDLVAQISPYLPTRRYVEVAWAAVLDRAWRIEDWLWLLGYAIVFGLLAGWSYRQDEGQRYR